VLPLLRSDSKENGAYLVATLGVYRSLAQRGEKGAVPEYMHRKAVEVSEKHEESFRMALEAEVKIAAGTDSGGPWYLPGQTLLLELEARCG
jgi:imidazolonepropionase-like amidohydrolase